MILKKSTVENIGLVFIFVIIAFLVSSGGYLLVNLFVLLISIFLFFFNRDLLLLIYLILLPTNGFISTDHNFLGFLHVSYIINLFTTISISYEWYFRYKYQNIETTKLKGVKKHINWFIIFVLLYLILTDLRTFFLGLNEVELYKATVTRPIKHFVMFFPLLALTREFIYNRKRKLIERGFQYSLALISISIIFSGLLTDIGFYTKEPSKITNILNQETFVRSSGFFSGLGDVNTAAGYLAIGTAYLLFFTPYMKYVKKISLISLLGIAIFHTGSRAGLANLFLVYLLYFLSFEISIQKKILYGGALIVVGIGVFQLQAANQIVERFQKLIGGETGHFDAEYIGGRLGGWVLYMDFIFSDINITMWGTTENLYKTFVSYDYERAAHNFYISLWYYWGVFAVIIFLSKLSLFVRSALRSSYAVGMLAIFIPLTSTLFVVSDIGILIGFIMSLIVIPNSSVYDGS